MDAWNIAQRYAFFCVKLGDNATTTHRNFSRPLEMTQCPENKTFAGTKCFLDAENLLKMNSAADDHQQQGQVTTQQGKENLFDPIED
jgi:hypothetical protein